MFKSSSGTNLNSLSNKMLPERKPLKQAAKLYIKVKRINNVLENIVNCTNPLVFIAKGIVKGHIFIEIIQMIDTLQTDFSDVAKVILVIEILRYFLKEKKSISMSHYTCEQFILLMLITFPDLFGS